MTSELYYLPSDCDFSLAPNNYQGSTECSPQLTDPDFSPFKGLLINAATKTILPKGLEHKDIELSPKGDAMDGNKIMVAGFLKLPGNMFEDCENLAFRVLVVAVNQKTAQTYSCKMLQMGLAPVLPILPERGENEIVSDTWQNFNIDLIQNLELPLVTADYTVYATFGELESNTINISVEFK